MKKYLDKLKKQIKINNNLFVFLVVLVIVGIASGAVFSTLLNESDKTLVTSYMNDFMEEIKTGSIVKNSSLINNLTFTFGYALLIWLFGISVIGIVLIIPFLFLKSFILGFSVGSIITNFKFKGIILSLIYIMPHHIINILIYILISSYAITVSYKLMTSFKNKKVFDFKKIMNRYTFILLFSEAILIISATYETYGMPHILKFAVKMIK